MSALAPPFIRLVAVVMLAVSCATALNAGLNSETLIAVVRNSENKHEIRAFDLANPAADAPSKLLLSSEQIGSDEIIGLDIDITNRRMFYSVRSLEPAEYRVKVSPLEGGTVRVIATEPETIVDVAYDPAGDRVFYSWQNDIKEVAADGDGNPKIWEGYNTNLTFPEGLAVDQGGNNLIWAEFALDDANVYMIPLSSTGQEPILVVDIPLTGIETVNYLTVDPVTSLLYVTHIAPPRASAHSLAAPGGPVTPFWTPTDSPGIDVNGPEGIFTRNDLGRVFFGVSTGNSTHPGPSHLLSANLGGDTLRDLGTHDLLQGIEDIFIVKKDVVQVDDGLDWKTVALVAGCVLGVGSLVGVVVCATSGASDYRSDHSLTEYSVATSNTGDGRDGRARSGSRGRRPSNSSGPHGRRRSSRGSNTSGRSGRSGRSRTNSRGSRGSGSGGRHRKKSKHKRGTLTPAPTYGLEDPAEQARRVREIEKKGY